MVRGAFTISEVAADWHEQMKHYAAIHCTRQLVETLLYIFHLLSICCMLKNLKNLKDIASQGKPISKLQSVTCHKESHRVTCHSPQVNVPRHKTSRTDW